MALELDEKSAKIHSTLRPFHPRTSTAYLNAGVRAEILQKYETALAYFNESLKIIDTLSSKGHKPKDADKTYYGLYRVYTALGDMTNATIYENMMSE
jgi:tetratricopeptide (TPR) repeat protein